MVQEVKVTLPAGSWSVGVTFMQAPPDDEEGRSAPEDGKPPGDKPTEGLHLVEPLPEDDAG